MSYVPLSSEHIPNRGIEEWTSILVDYVYQLVGDPEAVEQLVAGVLGNKALSTLSLSAADAYLQVLTDATDSACNYLILRDEADRLPPLPYHYAITGTPERMAEDSIGRAARKLPVLKRAALALSDQLSLDPSQVAQVLREPADQTARLIQEARQEYAEHLDEIVHLRGQLPLANIAPAIALGLRPRYGYAKSAYALLPPFELPADRLELLKWNALKNQDALPAQPAPRLPAQRQPAAWNWSLQPALFVGALAALMVGAWVLGRLSAATSAPAAVVIFVTATPTATREIVALPAPATSTPTPTSTATPVRAPTETPTLVPVPSAGATEVPATPSAPDATPTAEETDEPELPLSPTGTSTPRIVRRVVPRPTSTPTRIIYVAVPTRTPTRVPTRTPTPVAPTPLPTSTPTATVAPTATPTQALPSATPLKPPTPTATSIPPTPTRTATSVPPTATPTKTPLPPTPTLTPTKALAAATPTKTTAPPATKTPTLTPAP